MGLTLRLAAGSQGTAQGSAGLRGIVAVSIRLFLVCPGGAVLHTVCHQSQLTQWVTGHRESPTFLMWL